MSLKPDDQHKINDASIEYGSLLEKHNPLRLFSEHIYPIFKDDDFKECYSDNGRRGISPSLLSLITILQWRENLSDVETLQACNFRMDWKIALHLGINEINIFDPSTLCRFRRRLLDHDKASLMFDKILNLCIENGFVKKTGKQRVDATHIVKHINRIATTDLLFRSVKALMEELEKKYHCVYETKVPRDIQERYGHKFSSFGMSKQRRSDKQAEIIQDGLVLHALAKDSKIENDLLQLSIMLTVFRENVIIHEKEVNEKIFIEVEEVQSPKQTIFDPKDPTIKIGIKGKTTWVGAKCQIIETAEPKGTINFITGVIEEPAEKSDQKSHEAILDNNGKYGLVPEKMFADSNYISASAMENYRRHSTELMVYFTAPSTRRPGFGVYDFKIDYENYSAICPMGKNSLRTKLEESGERLIHFDKSDCMVCQNFTDCVNTKRHKAKQLRLSKYFKEISEHRKMEKTESFKNEMKLRPAIEGTISELVRFVGFRKIKYKTRKGRQFQCSIAATALNVRRFLRAVAV